jgi:DUF971 family protein
VILALQAQSQAKSMGTSVADTADSAPVAVVVGADPADTATRLRVATDLRAAGIAARADLSRRKLGKQFESAAKERAHFVVIIGDELAVKWDDGSESYVELEALRRHCPCAGCKGEMDIMGQVYKGPERALTPQAFGLVRIISVGGYAVQPVWADGHASGIYSFDYLRRVADAT